MLPKLVWSIAPLALYAVFVAVLAMRGRAPSRMALNVHTSLLLLAYLLTTAGLGIFWVANQQLPVFDWHYLFGYATLALVGLHLVFNLPLVVRWLTRAPAKPAPVQAGSVRVVGNVLAVLLALGVAYYIGTRQGGGEVQLDTADGATQAVIRYHEYASESRTRVFQRAPGVAWGDAPPPFKHVAGETQIGLPAPAPGDATLAQALQGPRPGKARLDLGGLARILHLAAGVTERRGGLALRAAPSSGALFPSELYVAARRVIGLPPGLYHYDPDTHRLARLAGTLPEELAGDADALLMLSAVFRRTGYKYHNRAYRYALADAGHLLENARLAAHAAGVQARLLPQFDESAMAQTLGIDGVEEGVLALMAIGAQVAPVGMAPLPAMPAAASSTLGVTGTVHQLTSLRARPGAAAGNAIALPAALPAEHSLDRTIGARRSQRRFSDAPLKLATVASMLADLRQQPQLSDAIEINLLVNRVEGLAPGVYRYGPGHALRPLRTGQMAALGQSAALSQAVIGDAAAVLILSSERDQMLASGPRGYRHGFLETGMIGERWLLSAVARGLGACPVGAFYDDEAAALLAADPRRHWVLHFAALGVPAG